MVAYDPNAIAAGNINLSEGNLLSGLDLSGAMGIGQSFNPMGSYGATTQEWKPDPMFNTGWSLDDPYGLGSLTGATDIYGGRVYGDNVLYQQPTGARTGYGEMQRLNEALGLTARQALPEDLSGAYMPHRPYDSSSPYATQDLFAWHKYYTDNPELRKYLSFDEQVELGYLDQRTGRFTDSGYSDYLTQLRQSFGDLPSAFGMSDFEAKLSSDMTRKHDTANPYADLLGQYGVGIGGYWNPENDSGMFQDFMNGPVGQFVQVASVLSGNPYAAALTATASGVANKQDPFDILKGAGLSAASAWLPGQLSAAAEAAKAGQTMTGLQTFLANPVNAAVATGGLAGLQGGDLQDIITSGLLSYARNPLSGVGQTLGQSANLPGALGQLSYGDLLNTGYKSATEGLLGTVGGVLGGLDFGELKDYALFQNLPTGLQGVLGDVDVADILGQIGGTDSGALMSILGDLNNPMSSTPVVSGNLKGWWDTVQNTYEDVEGWLQDTPMGQAVTKISKYVGDKYDLSEEVVQDLLDKDLVDVPENLRAAYQDLEGALQHGLVDPIQDAWQNLSMPDVNLPNVNLPNVNLPNVNLPNINLPNISLPTIALGGGGMLGGQQQQAWKPYTKTFDYDLRSALGLDSKEKDPLTLLLEDLERRA